jgi:ABC-type uncharacterized transport system involved in gliding motility auxiliary subunit
VVKFLKGSAAGFGALLLALAFVLSGLVPERRTYIASVAVFGLVLFVAGFWLNRDRVVAALKGKKARAAGASVGYTLTVLAVLMLVNFLAGRHHKRFDLTESKQFSLSEQTIKILESLPRDVSVTAFYADAEPTKSKLEDLLGEYKYHTRKLTVQYIDPFTHPGDAKRYGISEANTIVVESGKNESRVNTADEESLTNALIKVTKDREKIVYFTTGHGERDLAGGEKTGLTLLKGELEKQHYTVKPLVTSQGVPQDASVVVIAGPQKPFLDAEARMIEEFLRKGGHLLYLEDPESASGLESVLEPYGLSVRHDVIVDKVSRLFGGDYLLPLVAPDGYDEFHPITKTFRYQTIFPLASSVEIKTTLPEGVTATKLAQTSPMSWAQPDSGELKTGRITLKEGSGTKGPVTIAAAATKKLEAAPKAEVEPAKAHEQDSKPSAETRLVVFGDSDFLTNGFFNASGDGDLALNTIAWLSEQEELVSIRPKTSQPRIVVLSRQQVMYYLLTIVAVAPLAITATGVAIWWRRKKL